MRTFNLALYLVLGVLIVGFGIYRLQYIHSDWRSWLSIAIGVYFLVRGYLTFRSSAPRQ